MNPIRALIDRIMFPVIGAIGLGLVVALLLTSARARHWRKQAETSEALRISDRATWAAASKQATLNAVLNIQRVAETRAKIDERTIHALTADRQSADAGYQRLLAQAATHRSAPGRADLSEEREATCRSVANATCDEIPPLLKAAQDNTDQLMRWIEWGKAQGEVETVPAPDQKVGGQ